MEHNMSLFGTTNTKIKMNISNPSFEWVVSPGRLVWAGGKSPQHKEEQTTGHGDGKGSEGGGGMGRGVKGGGVGIGRGVKGGAGGWNKL